jgi:hypothetical protein
MQITGQKAGCSALSFEKCRLKLGDLKRLNMFAS